MNAESPRGFFPSVSRCFSRPPCRMNGSGKPQLLGPSERIVFVVPMSTSFTDLGSRPTAKNPPQTQVPRFCFFFGLVLPFHLLFLLSVSHVLSFFSFTLKDTLISLVACMTHSNIIICFARICPLPDFCLFTVFFPSLCTFCPSLSL